MVIKNLLLSIALAVAVVALPVSTIHAGDGDVKLIMDGETYYLSTDATESGGTRTLTATRSATQSGVMSDDVLNEAPPGYIEDVGALINFALQLVMVLALLLVLFMLVTAGIEWITSGGDKSKTENARNRIVAAIVGTIILAASYALVQLLAYILGFESFNQAITNIPQIGR